MTQLQTIFDKALDLAIQEIQEELRNQGYGGGPLEKDIVKKLVQAEGLTGELWMNFYYQWVNNPTPGARIPFSGRTGKGGTSKYIQALIDFFKRKGAKNAISAAFATAYTQKREGRPTRGSYRFSRNGKRTGFLQESLPRIQERIFSLISQEVERYIQLEIFKTP